MQAHAAMLSALLVCACVYQGCGSSEKTTATGFLTKSTASGPSTRTAGAKPPQSGTPTKPLTSRVAAAAFNEAFKGYDNTDQSTPSGVTISWLKHEDDKVKLYCPDIHGHDSDGCYEASATCRMSAMIHNRALPLIDGKMFSFSKRSVGVIFNQTLVEKYFGKCSFIYDGGSNDRYNHGCGNGALAKYKSCHSTHSAFGNICPSSGKTCTADDPEVNAVEIDRHGGHVTDYVDRNMFHKGPAYNISEKDILSHWNGETMWETKDALRTMVDDRFKIQEKIGERGCGNQCWNEVILDERLILTQLWWDPATAVAGFVYYRGDSRAKEHAKTIQKNFQDQWHATPPLVSVDTGCNVAEESCAPFYADV